MEPDSLTDQFRNSNHKTSESFDVLQNTPAKVVRRAENQKGCITNTKTETSTETGVLFNNNNNNNNNNGLLMTE